MDVAHVDLRSSAVLRGLPADRDELIQRVLRSAREHLGLDVAFVSQFVDDQRVFRYVDSEETTAGVRVGAGDPLEETYCHYVTVGALPGFLRDPSQHPVSSRLSATESLGIGTHLSVPIRLSDGRVYGTFCCFALDVHPELDPRDLRTIEMLADLVGDQLESLDSEERERSRRRARVAAVLADPSRVDMVFQPLVGLATDELIGVEALARFTHVDAGPQQMFAEAWDVGLGVALELMAIRLALPAIDELPGRSRLGVNASPATLVTAEFREVMASVPPFRLTVEVTEHAAIDDYREVKRVRERLRLSGIRLAIDDVGMGFSGLHHIIEIAPDTLKIDKAVVTDVHRSAAKAAMIEALVSFARRMDVLLVAEGIETEDERRTLMALGVPVGQGFHFARPSDLQSAIARH